MSAYYNEHDPFAAEWLRALIKRKLIADGDVDERPIQDVEPADVRDYTQVHLFAGIGGWSYALRLAQWADDRPVWTGSCPCQPWSIANVYEEGGKGYDDTRHLWPYFFYLISECRPAVIFGEQVPGAIRKGWLDAVFDELETEDYACAAVVLPAVAVGAKHQRNRIYFVADSCGAGRKRHQPVKRFSFSKAAPLSVDGDPLADARRALAGNYSDLLPCDGLSVQLERHALRGYGNAIVPQAAQAFIEAYLASVA